MIRYLHQCNIPIEIYEYAPDAPDDLFDTFVNGLVYSTKEFEKKTGLKKAAIAKLKEILERSEVNSLSQLSKAKGVGEETIKACYQFAIQSKKQPIAIPQEIFNEKKLQNTFNGDNKTTAELTTPDRPTEKLYEGSSSKNLDATQTVIESPEETTQGKKRAVQRKKSKEYTLVEKILFTGLDEDTITKIETKDENIKDLKTYCNGLKISFRSFVSKQYEPESKIKISAKKIKNKELDKV